MYKWSGTFVSAATLLQLVAELSWIFIAGMLALWIEGTSSALVLHSIVPALVFSILMVSLNGTFGLYRRDRHLGFGAYVTRLLIALLIGAPTAYVVCNALPGGEQFQPILGATVILAFCGLLLVRRVVVSQVLHTLLPHRVLVLGTGREAKTVGASIDASRSGGIELVGFYALDKIPEQFIPSKHVIAGNRPLEEIVERMGVDEIIVAVREQRGGVLPLRALLECRIAGVQVTDLARFFERVHGLIPTDCLKASWLIYGSGFRQDWRRSLIKRTFDIVVSTLLLLLTLPVMALTAVLILLESGAPVFYRQQRVGLGGRNFDVLKFRSMRKNAESDGKPSWAAVDDARVTRLGRVLRRSRIDELPQLINVFRGEMSLVGPRPERPPFVAMLAEQIPFYGVRHSVKPGITGWAQVRYSYGATVEQSMRKLEYDLYYVKNHTLLLDLLILLETIRVVLFGEGAR